MATLPYARDGHDRRRHSRLGICSSVLPAATAAIFAADRLFRVDSLVGGDAEAVVGLGFVAGAVVALAATTAEHARRRMLLPLPSLVVHAPGLLLALGLALWISYEIHSQAGPR